MNKKALLLGYSDLQGSPLQGIKHDHDNIKKFLQSPLGGCWDETEIISHIFETHLNGKQNVSFVPNYIPDEELDYLFILYSGHGRDGLLTPFSQSSPHNIPIKNFLSAIKAKKALVIIDACRDISKNLKEDFIFSFQSSLLENEEKCPNKADFEDALKKSQEGITVCFTANQQESALEFGNNLNPQLKGSLFINMLLRVLHEKGNNGIIYFNETLIEEVKVKMNNLLAQSGHTEKQTPELKAFSIQTKDFYHSNSLIVDFPFAVK